MRRSDSLRSSRAVMLWGALSLACVSSSMMLPLSVRAAEGDKPAEKTGAKPADAAAKPDGAKPEAAAPGKDAKPANPGGPAAKPDAPPVSVTTVVVQAKDVDVSLRTQGVVASARSVDVRAQATSVITQVHVREGQSVKTGQLLFTLDARADEANLAKAKAQLAKDAASLADARRQLERAQQLVKQGFISQGAADTAQAQVDAQTATLALDQAAIDAVQVSLSNSRVMAPQSGRVGAIPVSVGSAVVANQTPLVSITQLDPIEVSYSVPQRNLPDLLQAMKAGGAPVQVSLLEGGAPVEGKLRFVDSLVDATTGSVKAKAEMPNKGNRLWPGAAVEVRQIIRSIKGALVVPTASMVQGQRGTIVFVNESGLAALKPVKVVFISGQEAVITGLNEGDKVVLDGKQNVRPGSKLMERAPGEGKAGDAKPGDAKPGEGKPVEGKPGDGKPAAGADARPADSAKPAVKP